MAKPLNPDTLKRDIAEVVEKEIEEVRVALGVIDDSYVEAATLLAACEGKVIFTGVGKSGHIGAKLAATFSSVGISSFFMHATEAVHGDLGMVTDKDTVIAISNSGETSEVLRILPSVQLKGVSLIAITANRESSLGRAADVTIAVRVNSEADPYDLAPTCSTTAVLMAGDALALALERIIGFDERGFGINHPGGALGRRLVEQGVLKEAIA